MRGSLAKIRRKPIVLLDEDFDADDGFVDAVLTSIQRCGTIDVHPNGWGIHDGIRANSDDQPTRLTKNEVAIAPNKSATERRKEVREADIGIELAIKVAAFEHATAEIACRTASDYMQVGAADAAKRGITTDDWLWKRSRFLAGFK